jgi:homoserine dehydrogenase
MAHEVRLVLVGLGNLGRRFCRILADKARFLEERYRLRLVLVGAADSRGTAHSPGGLDPALIARIKEEGGSVRDYPGAGSPGTALELVKACEAEVLCEATPVNLDAGAEPGLSVIREALSRGMHVVTPNKGPIVLAYRELSELARKQGVELRFDGTVAGGLPALYLGARDLRGAEIKMVEAVPNLVTGYILDLLAEGLNWEEALTRARKEGALEADPSFDLDGWDAAAKLVILANHVLGYPARLEDVEREGIRGVDPEEVRRARERGGLVRLVARAKRRDGGYRLTVRPEEIPPGHLLSVLGRKGMGVVYHTDIYGTISATIREEDPVPSAATMLRDILDIYCNRQR